MGPDGAGGRGMAAAAATTVAAVVAAVLAVKGAASRLPSASQHPWLQMHDDALCPFDFASFVRTVNELRQAPST